MKLILTENVEHLGIIGAEVDVAKGYARNYLLPKKKAVLATDANRAQVEKQRLKWEKKMAEQRLMAEQIAARLAGMTITIEAKVSEGERLYGSVNRRDIVKALAEKGVEIEKGSVKLEEAVKELGTYKVAIHIFEDISPEITLEVKPVE